MPPGRRDFTECDQVAAPTVSMTASTRCGSRAPGSTASTAPSSSARFRFASFPAGGEDPQPGRLAEDDRGRGDTAARPLHQDRVTRSYPGVGEQHPVRRQPGRRQTGRLGEGQLLRLGQDVPGRHGDLFGEGALIALGEDGARLAGADAVAGLADDGVQDDLVAVRVDAGGVAAEDHRQPFLRQADAPQGPEVVVVEGSGPHRDGAPAGTDPGSRTLPQLRPVSGWSRSIRAA
ncbi:hypothetical protein GCM10017687_35030 [Streptomyces echinatus]